MKDKLRKFAEYKLLPNCFEFPFHLKSNWKQSVFQNTHPMVLELGCGKGEYTVALSGAFPEKNFVGIDVKSNRMWKGAKFAAEMARKNVAFCRLIIEKIDIGGVSLIRAAAKNYKDVVIISSKNQYAAFLYLLNKSEGTTTLSQRKEFASQAFALTASYDAAIANWFNPPPEIKSLRYGENPHQKAIFSGNVESVFNQLHGKEISFNNLLDIDAALSLIEEFPAQGCAVIKHNNACGAALSDNSLTAFKMALAGDPLSAFGGIIVFNSPIDLDTAIELDGLFFEILLAPNYSEEALQKLKSKKNRILLKTKDFQDASNFRIYK